MTKWNYIFGAITITAIVGGTVYVIVKAKQAEKLEEESITVEEAQAMVARENGDIVEETVKFESKIVEEADIPQTIKVAPISSRPYELEDEEEPEEMDEGIEELQEDEPMYGGPVNPLLDVHPIEPLIDYMYFDGDINPKEDKVLRHHKDSDEARHQFIRMELSDWDPGDESYMLLLPLFEIPLYPTNVGDDILRTQVIDYKAQFFGITSKWVREVSFADIMFHYARKASFNCGDTVAHWMDCFFTWNEFYSEMTTREMEMMILRLANHTYFNEERQTYGLFGLSREAMDNATYNASRNPDRSVTFEIEFQEFLKTCI